MMTTNQRRTRAAGDCRERPRTSGRRVGVRPERRLYRAIRSSVRLIEQSGRMADRCERSLRRRPARTSQQLDKAAARLNMAALRLIEAAAEFGKANGTIPTQRDVDAAPPLVRNVSARVADVFGRLERTFEDVADMQDSLIDFMEDGVVPPAPASRQRIRLTAPAAPIRTFLEVRQARVADRIAPLLRRRRRTPRPAEVRVPRSSLLGRAPPAVSISLL